MREVLRILNENWLCQASMRGGCQRCRGGGTHYDPRDAGNQDDADRCHGLPFLSFPPRDPRTEYCNRSEKASGYRRGTVKKGQSGQQGRAVKFLNSSRQSSDIQPTLICRSKAATAQCLGSSARRCAPRSWMAWCASTMGTVRWPSIRCAAAAGVASSTLRTLLDWPASGRVVAVSSQHRPWHRRLGSIPDVA
jgi:hypothetical protein